MHVFIIGNEMTAFVLMVSRILRPKLSDGQMHIEAKKDGMVLLCR